MYALWIEYLWIKSSNSWSSKCFFSYLSYSVFVVYRDDYRNRGSAEINNHEIRNIKPFTPDQQCLIQGGRSFYTGNYGHHNPTPVFIKRIEQTSNERKAIMRECRNHSKLSNPNIIEFIGYFFEGNTVSIVTKRADCSLNTYLIDHPELNINQRKYILYSVAYGLVYLKWNNVSHHDLKVMNVLHFVIQ